MKENKQLLESLLKLHDKMEEAFAKEDTKELLRLLDVMEEGLVIALDT